MAVTTGEWTKHATAAADVITDVMVQGFGFHGGTTIAHECKITDNTGQEAFHAKVAVANDQTYIMFPTPRFYKKLTVATLGSGEFIVYIV